MTTAHRPTWKAAVARVNEGGWTAGGAVSTQKSALDAPGQLSLKLRAQPVDKNKALKESLLALERAESSKNKTPAAVLQPRPMDPAQEERAQQRLLKQTAEVDVAKLKEQYDDSDADDDGGGKDDGNSSDESDLDKDSSSDSDKDSDSDDDDDDDEEALQAELAKIRAEREQERQKAQAEADRAEEAEQEESALLGNPLLAGGVIGGGGNGAGSNNKRRRWNDDVVFRNQAKGEPKPKKRFINDTVRNDFHKRFLNKFIR